MKKISWFILLLIGMGSISAQPIHKRVSTIPGTANVLAGTDTLKILALMVEFQSDKYDATTGTGKFGSHYTKEYGDTILDPLPHDANYFSDHLLFAKNYFKKVSKGKLEIKYKVLPQVITVSNYMRDYTTAYNSNDLSPLGQFAKEAWELADQKFTDVKFSDYNLFIIFHAGVSNGLDLGTFSIDRNMPSVYLSTGSLATIFGNSFSGFATKTGKITNTIILPETESREQDNIDGSITMTQVSINGEIANNIGNHIGLPDLFNTKTGLSAIGRFGLMDAQSIGANNGMFPPEPSPWEKMKLGWESPNVYSGNPTKINIATKQTAALIDTTVLKVPVNSSEYYLVENRQQDALKNNVVLTIKRSGQIFTKTILPDTSGYFYVSPESVHGGVVIDVDEYDASVPGNGIVIWHIDENIINAKISANEINADANNKGVSVVEADGIQEIGITYDTPFGTMIGDGYFEDLWCKGNKAKYYTNKFGPDSKPSTKSNSGSNTYLTLENFSSNSNKMSFDISYGSAVKKFQLPLTNSAKTLTQLSNGKDNFFFITDNTNLYKYNTNGEKVFSYNSFSEFKPAAIYYNNTEVVVGAIESKLNLYIKNSQQEFVRTIPLGNTLVTAVPAISFLQGNPILFVAENSSVRSISLKNILESNFIENEQKISLGQVKKISVLDDQYALINVTPFAVLTNFGFVWAPTPTDDLQASLSKNSEGIISLIILDANNTFSVYRNNVLINSFRISSSNQIKSFSLAQVDKGGENSILVFNGNKLEAYSMKGVLVDGFPITLGSKNLSGVPLTADLDASKTFETINLNELGNVYFANQSGVMKTLGGVINAGSSGKTLVTVFNGNNSTSLATLDESNTLSIWNLSGTTSTLGWINIFGDETNSNSATAVATEAKTAEYFPVEKAYNWPNPVYGSSTNFRFYVLNDSDVTIKIVDLSGSLVANITGKGIGGVDNEIAWDVSKIQSGIYYANLEVKDQSGKSANKIIKIAVIK